VTQKFVRWNCPNCSTHNVAPISDGSPPAVLHCDYCQYVNDPMDDTWPRPEGWTAEETPASKPRATPRPGTRQTPG
jgi:hypothetical protein